MQFGCATLPIVKLIYFTMEENVVNFIINEPQLGLAAKSLKLAIKGHRVTGIKCTLSKTRLKIDCGAWGCAIVPAKSEKVVKFTISNKSLGMIASSHRALKKGSKNAPARLHRSNCYLETTNLWMTYWMQSLTRSFILSLRLTTTQVNHPMFILGRISLF